MNERMNEKRKRIEGEVVSGKERETETEKERKRDRER